MSTLSTASTELASTIGLIGVGRVGRVLAIALARAGYRITAIYNRTARQAHELAELLSTTAVPTAARVAQQADLVFITTADSMIEQICREIAEQQGWRPRQAVIHCSGALGRAVLGPAEAQGAQTGSFHPLQTFPSTEQGLANLPGSYFCIEAEEPLHSLLQRLARDLKGYPFDFAGHNRALYHTAAAITSNYTVTLFATAVRLLEEIGIGREIGMAALLPLLRGTIASLEHDGIPQALTGPIARGDSDTVKKHLQALTTNSPQTVDLYLALVRATLPLAIARGLDTARAEQIRVLLEDIR